MGDEAREKAADTQLVSWYRHRLRLLYIYSAYRERRQVLLTPLTTPWTCTLGYMRFSYELLLRCSTRSRTTVYTLQSIVGTMPHYVYTSSSSSPHSASFHFLRSSSSSPPFASSFYLSFVFPFISLFLHQPTMDFFPLFQVSAHSFPTSYEFAFDDIVLAPLARSR